MVKCKNDLITHFNIVFIVPFSHSSIQSFKHSVIQALNLYTIRLFSFSEPPHFTIHFKDSCVFSEGENKYKKTE